MGFLRLFRENRIWLRWAGRGFWAVVDQAFFSGASFIANVLLARWLAPNEYGAFAVAMSFFYLLAGFHSAVLTEPMMVFGAGKYRDCYRKYLGVLFYGHIGFSAMISFLLGVAALAAASFGSGALAQTMTGLAIASPALLFLWLTRRGCYVLLRPTWAAVGSGINLLTLVVGMFALVRLRAISPFSGVGIMGAAATFGGLFLAYILRPQIRGWRGNPTPKAILLNQWAYARWSLATVLLTWVPGNIYFSILPLADGLNASAALRALHNIVLPALYIIQALTALAIPLFSAALRRDHGKFTGLVGQTASVMLFVAIFYYILLTLFGRATMRLLYGTKYLDVASLLLLVGLVPIIGSVTSVVGGALRALERPDRIFLSYVSSTIAALVAGVPLTLQWGLTGAVMGQLIGALTTAAVMLWFYSKDNKRGSK